jgi:hypothetical protein
LRRYTKKRAAALTDELDAAVALAKARDKSHAQVRTSLSPKP